MTQSHAVEARLVGHKCHRLVEDHKTIHDSDDLLYKTTHICKRIAGRRVFYVQYVAICEANVISRAEPQSRSFIILGINAFLHSEGKIYRIVLTLKAPEQDYFLFKASLLRSSFQY